MVRLLVNLYVVSRRLHFNETPMSLRDNLTRVLRSWNAYEINSGQPPIIDYDCQRVSPSNTTPARNRSEVLSGLLHLEAEIGGGDSMLVSRIQADVAYLKALLGERAPLGEYIQLTQGCYPHGWPEEYIDALRDSVRRRLADRGTEWGPQTSQQLDLQQIEATGGSPLKYGDAADFMKDVVGRLKPSVCELVGVDPPFEVDIRVVDEDTSWNAWLSGAGSHMLFQLNRNSSRVPPRMMTRVEAKRLAIHEVLGHALQYASFAQRYADDDVPWVPILSTHAPHQIMLEGLAQTLPCLVAPDDEQLMDSVHLGHYRTMVLGQLHAKLAQGATDSECADYAKSHVPSWSAQRITGFLQARRQDPNSSSYKWAYPAGAAWFMALASAEPETVKHVLRTCYQDPLAPADLAVLWPAGPPIGGPAPQVAQRSGAPRRRVPRRAGSLTPPQAGPGASRKPGK